MKYLLIALLFISCTKQIEKPTPVEETPSEGADFGWTGFVSVSYPNANIFRFDEETPSYETFVRANPWINILRTPTNPPILINPPPIEIYGSRSAVGHANSFAGRPWTKLNATYPYDLKRITQRNPPVSFHFYFSDSTAVQFGKANWFDFFYHDSHCSFIKQ